MIPTFPAQKSVWSTPLHSILVHGGTGRSSKSLEWMTSTEMEVNSCLRIQYHPLLNALWSWGLCNLFVPSLSIAGSTAQNHQEITGSEGEENYLLHLESHWFPSWPQKARRERHRLLIFAEGWECEWGTMPYGSNTGLRLEGRVCSGLLFTAKPHHQVSALPSSWGEETTALTKLGAAAAAKAAQVGAAHFTAD